MDIAALARSWLFAPGDSAHKMARARESEADLVLLDLEDAVAPEAKDAARRAVGHFLQAHPEGRARLWVRINPLGGAQALRDLAAIMPGRPGGILLPKAQGRADLEALDRYLSALEVTNGIAQGTTPVAALVTETAAAMFRTGDYAGAPRLRAMSWGAEDLADALGASSNRTQNGAYAFTYELARSLTLLGAAAAGVAAIETIAVDFRDLDALRLRAEQARRDGFTGMLAIHPMQVPVINAAFLPDAQERAQAQAIVDLFAANPGVGVVALDGAMLDRPHLARAQKVLRRAAMAAANAADRARAS